MNRSPAVFLQGLQCTEYATYIGRVNMSVTLNMLTGLANQLYVRALADGVNRFFQGVAADLSPLE